MPSEKNQLYFLPADAKIWLRNKPRNTTERRNNTPIYTTICKVFLFKKLKINYLQML